MKPRIPQPLASLIALTVLPAMVAAAPPPAGSGSRPVVLVDESHDQRFTTRGTGPLQLTRLGELLNGAGVTTRIQTAALTAKALEGVSGVLISGPFQAITGAEIQALDGFLRAGGRLAVALHIGPPASALLRHLGVSISNGVIHEPEHAIGPKDTDFVATDLTPTALFGGVKTFSLYGAWALLPPDRTQTKAIAKTGPHAFVDLNANGTRDSGDATQAFAVAVLGRYGRGAFVAFGDDAIFQNRFLKGANAVLAKNLARWLAGETPQTPQAP